MPHEPNSKHTDKERQLNGDVEPIIEHRPRLEERYRKTRVGDRDQKPTVGKKRGSGRRIHSPRDNSAR